jgi:hypothetical protein
MSQPAHVPRGALRRLRHAVRRLQRGLLAEQLFPGHGERWPAVARQADRLHALCSMSGRYQPFWDLTRAGLRFAALRLGLTLDAGAEDRLMNQYRHLSAFPENREVLQELQRARRPAGILSNGDPEMLAVAVKSAGFDGLLRTCCRCMACALQDRPRRLRAGPAGAGPAGARHPVRLQQRLGRHRRHLVRLHHAVGQPGGAPLEQLGTDPHAHRQQPARRARLLS